MAQATLEQKLTYLSARLIGGTPANEKNIYNVTLADLPLSCPMPGMLVWNSHPRVRLAIEASGTAKCPYCGALYILKPADFT